MNEKGAIEVKFPNGKRLFANITAEQFDLISWLDEIGAFIPDLVIDEVEFNYELDEERF